MSGGVQVLARVRPYGRALVDVAGHAAVVYVAAGPHDLPPLFRVLGADGCWWAVQDVAREREQLAGTA